MYTARKHQVPVLLTVTALESANDAGGSDPLTACVVTGLPTWVPFGAGQAPPPVWVGPHTKNVTVPLGVFVAWLPVTVAVSCTATPGKTGPASETWVANV